MERDAGVACPPAARLNHRSWPPPGMGIEPDRTEPACIGRYHPSCEARPIQAVIQAVGTIQAVSCCVCAAACGQMFRVRRLTRANTRYGAPSPLCPSPGRVGLRLGGSGGLSDGCYRATVKSAGGCPSCILATPSWSNLAPLRRGFFVRVVSDFRHRTQSAAPRFKRWAYRSQCVPGAWPLRARTRAGTTGKPTHDARRHFAPPRSGGAFSVVGRCETNRPPPR